MTISQKTADSISTDSNENVSKLLIDNPTNFDKIFKPKTLFKSIPINFPPQEVLWSLPRIERPLICVDDLNEFIRRPLPKFGNSKVIFNF